MTISNPERTTMCGPPPEGWRTPKEETVNEEINGVQEAFDPGSDSPWKQIEPGPVDYILKRQAEDEISHPSHYTQGSIEVIDFIEDQALPYHLANVVKYICRAPYKGTEKKDLKKAAWYLDRYIETYLDSDPR